MSNDPIVRWNWQEAGHVTNFMGYRTLLNQTYIAYGNYSIHLTIGNNIAVEEMWLDAYIEPELKDVMLVGVEYKPSASPLNIEVWIRGLEQNKTFPFYTWCRIDVGDGREPEIFSMISETVKQYTYVTDAANASLDVLCHNHVSSVSFNEEILLRTNISNLTVASVTDACTVGVPCAFIISMESGSHVSYIIDAADLSNTMEYRDPSRIASTVSFNFTHVYQSPNNYSLHVYAYNEHFQAQAVLVYPVIVQTPVPALKLEGQDTVVIPDGSTEFVLSGDSAGEPPSQVFCKWNFRTNDTETYYAVELMGKRSEKTNFTYERRDVGEPLIIGVECYNLVSTRNASFSFRVEEMIGRLNILPSAQFVIPGSNIEIQITLSVGSRVQFRIDYGDGTVNTIGHPQLFAVSEPVDTWHPYDAFGNYTVNVTAWNLVNTVTNVSEYLIIQNRVVNLSLAANESVLWPPGEVDYILELGQDQRELSDLHCIWHFDPSVQEYSYLKSLSQTTSYTHKHIFPRSAVGNATVKVNCSNLVSWQEIETVVEVVFDEVILGSLETRGSVLWANATVATLTIKRFGTYSCFRWDFGDGTEILYGVESCQTYALTDGLPFIEITIGQLNISVSHIYPDLGEYRISVYAFNHVSNDSLYANATIDDWPCEKPDVSFPAEYQSPLTIMRSEPLIFMGNVTVNCTKTTEYNVTLEVYTKDGQHLVAHASGFKAKEITFGAHTFQYGTYEIRYTAFLHLVHSVLNVEGMETQGIFEFEVTKTPLVVNIVHETKQWSPWNRTVIINAMDVTYDPDYPDDGDSLQYTWFCRLINETFSWDGLRVSRTPLLHMNGQRTNSLLGYGGCFGEGPGVLNFTSGKLKLDTQKLHVHTDYVLRVEVNRGDRWGYSEQTLSVGAADAPVIKLE